MMTKDEAIAALNYLAECTPLSSHYTSALQIGIDSLQCQKKLEWIPRIKKLPDPYIAVLISRRSNIVVIGWTDRDGQWKYDAGCLDDDEVLAWMPLPEPYVEETTDG